MVPETGSSDALRGCSSMIRAVLAIVLAGLSVSLDFTGMEGFLPWIQWHNFALMDRENRILGFISQPYTAPEEPRFGSGIWADAAAKAPLSPRASLGLGT